MDRVTGMDAAFLEMESPTMHLHVVGVLVLDPSTATGDVDLERLATLFAERLHQIPPFRWRVVEVPAGLDHPRWIHDADFDLSRHLQHRHLGPDAGHDDLERFVGEVASVALPRDRPLWETWLVDGFGDGSVALVSKVHHSLMDGAAGGDMMASLFDLEPDPSPPPGDEQAASAPGWSGEDQPHPFRLVLEAGPAALRRLAQVPGTVVRTLTGLAESARAVAAAPSSVAGFSPPSPLNGPLTAVRITALARCSMSDMKEIRRAFGTTINDVVLAATALSLRQYLSDRDVIVDRALMASVPVAGRRDAAPGELGNHTSNMMAPLPVHLDDPVEILRSVHEEVIGAKAAHHALEPEVLDEWIGLMPAGLLTVGAHVYSNLALGRLHPPMFNTIVSNVPGPPISLYLAGSRLTGTYAMGPLIGNAGLNLTVLSQNANLDVGVIACPDLVDDVRAIADGFVEGVAQLLAAARRLEPEGDSSGPHGARV